MSPRALPRTTVRSTTFTRHGAKVPCPPEALRDSRPKGGRERFPQVSPRRPVTVTLTWYPRSTPWVKVTMGTRVYWAPGHLAIVDLCMRVHGH